MPVRVAVYASSVAEGLCADKFEKMMDDAARYNKVAGVTGVLLFDGFRFFQYLEGPGDGVNSVYQKVRQSRSHTDLMDIAQGIISIRHLPYWSMKLIAVEEGVVNRLVAAQWGGFIRSSLGNESPHNGTDLLHEVVDRYIASVLLPGASKTIG